MIIAMKIKRRFIFGIIITIILVHPVFLYAQENETSDPLFEEQFVDENSVFYCSDVDGGEGFLIEEEGDGIGTGDIEYVPGVILLGYNAGCSEEVIRTSIEQRGCVFKSMTQITPEIIMVIAGIPDDITVETAIKLFSDDPNVLFAQPDFVYGADDGDESPGYPVYTGPELYFSPPVSQGKIDVTKGGSTQIIDISIRADLENKYKDDDFIWQIKNEEIAGITSAAGTKGAGENRAKAKGVSINGKKIGKTELTVTTADGRYSTSCIVYVNPFCDVTSDTSHYQQINWAYLNNIAKGYQGDCFKPRNACTRGQFMMFLWRLAGKPSPSRTDNAFSDVPKGHAFFKAVMWAREKGITKGVSATKFGVNDPLTRSQAMVFLWRYMGKPAVQGNANYFPDLPANSTHSRAIRWGASVGITKGYTDSVTGFKVFGPNDICNRGHVMTFLYKLNKLK